MTSTTYSRVLGGGASLVRIINYPYIRQKSQEAIWSTIANDATVKAITTNVMNGWGDPLTRSRGFPWVVISAPSLTEENLTFRAKRVFLNFNIKIATTEESTLWKLADAVQYAVGQLDGHAIGSNTGSDFMGKLHLHKPHYSSDAVLPEFLPDGRVVYNYDVGMEFEYIGEQD